MAAAFCLFGLLFPSVLSFGAAQGTSGHAYPLFEYETRSLTEEGLEKLLAGAGASDSASLFAFDDGTKANPGPSGPACKVFPGDAEWPAQNTWQTFDDLLGGALIETVPVAAPCYQNTGIYDAEKCAAVRDSFSNPYFHENDPTSIFWPLYQGRTCMVTDDPNSSNCTHGAFPVYAVNVSSVSQIQLAVNFARNANLRLVIKNTGHCYLGKSSGAGALSIWTHNLKNLEYHPDLEIPGYSGPAIKVGAGVTVREVYAEAERNDVSALGGICESVGYAGGYVTGGGHTPLSGLYGMAADHVMALEVVTADGHFITASPEENTDLYWALRGGGGGTFGVVTSIIIRVHPKLPVVTSTFTLSTSPTVSADAFWEAMYSYFSLFIPFTDAGTYSWFTLFSDTNGSHTFSMEPFFAPNHTLTSFTTLVEPWFAKLRALHIPFTPTTTAHPSFYAAYNATWGSNIGLNSAGRISVPSNRLLPRRNWEDPALFNATFAVLRRHASAGRLLMGYHQAPRNRAGVDNAVNSAWREAVCFLILSGRLPAGVTDPTAEQVRAASVDLQEEVIAPLREVAPESEGGGAYLNEANVDEPMWREAFYGVHYERLLEVKRAWDPREVFYATTAVGSEGWEVRDGEMGVQTQNGRLCRV
ncbi:uncharacterized protein B0H64DRAFT_49194 [Chaetomium fimeti]|uniref:FAD-binding PCMH-type domain-containing protein n=1 Tax=Chaetomium fimeti TaxID=1854472 RepID=A0AAE0H8I6_9PEZI|nr:hypothetical protein B0H64DRAFT_49194 [Chaetomium fimeti]